jgi:hypothetical protein
MKLASLLLVLSVVAAPLSAQATVILPEKALAPELEAVRVSLYEMRDSLSMVTASIASLRQDLRRSSAAAMSSRSRHLARSCASALPVVATTRASVVAAKPADWRQEQAQLRLLAGLDSLPRLLQACDSTFAEMGKSGNGEAVRGYANAKAAPLNERVNGYNAVSRGFFRAYRIEYRPAGVRHNPLAG